MYDRLRRHTGAAILVVLTASLVACSDDDGTTDGIAGEPSSTSTTETTESSEPADETGIELQDETLAVEVLLSDLDQPTAMAFLPDDRVLVTEKATGKVQLIADGEGTAEAIDLAVNFFDERGLLGIAVHPDFDTDPYVYLHWTWRGDGDGPEAILGEDTDEATEVPALGNRIDRFVFEDDHLRFDLNLVEFPSNTLETDTTGRVRGNHDAGPLTFGPDGKLYTMMGDQNLRGQLQNIVDGPPPNDEHLAGVILRLNDDGTIPEDNPFYSAGADIGGELGENIQAIYVYGVRNGFGLAFEPRSGNLWQTENGDDSFDEINVFEAGDNSGWIQIMGASGSLETFRSIEIESEDGLDVESFPPENLAQSVDGALGALFELPGSRFVEPVLAYVHPPALTAISLVPDDSLGGSSAGSAWVGTVLTDALIRYPLGDGGRSLAVEGGLADGVDDNESKGDLGESAEYVVGTGFGTITDIVWGPDESLYVVSISNGTLYRLSAGS